MTPQGVCTGCRQSLESIELSWAEQADLLSGLELYLAKQLQMQPFKTWLATRGRIDVVLDGMNIAHLQRPYFELNQVLVAYQKFKVCWQRKEMFFASSNCNDTTMLFNIFLFFLGFTANGG